MFKATWIIILLSSLGLANCLHAQQLSHQVIVPVAGVLSSKAVNYSQTGGETAVEIIGCTSYTFTQGFQQPGIKVASIDQPEGNGVDVYPNPVIEDLKIKLFGSDARDFIIEVINISGTIVISERLSFVGEFNYERIMSVGKLPKGLYFVRILSTDKLISRTFKIEKM